MADVRLGDYAGHLFLEMVRAREMADAYSRTVAERYASDPVMRHFPAPRFTMPKVSLSIPVLVSDVRFRSLTRFAFPAEEFAGFVAARAAGVQAHVAVADGKDLPGPGGTPSAGLAGIVHEFHERLTANPEPHHPDPIVTVMWERVFTTGLREAGLLEPYTRSDPARDLLARTTREVLDAVRRRTVVERTEIESLLVDPETAVVRSGGGTSVCTVNVELVEEGVYFRSFRDETTGQTRTVVEFE
ncbi:hypothetical protein ABGB17_34475 [Sphaerisporangium sp. B11E5]|uniref:hypothetical protein n=1 Tax=Sphaerisporangium sp. B11E5 TaxID=3153563 RepID=UPI00325CC43F